MRKDYCNFCWAKCSGGRCICKEESRSEHCKKAKIRMAADALTKNKELIGLREYMNYISNRIIYLKILSNYQACNEYKYLCQLRKRIKQWGQEHIIFYKYLRGTISLEEAKILYGISYRQLYRLATSQRKELIVFIEEQENLLRDQYPFDPDVDIMDDT